MTEIDGEQRSAAVRMGRMLALVTPGRWPHLGATAAKWSGTIALFYCGFLAMFPMALAPTATSGAVLAPRPAPWVLGTFAVFTAGRGFARLLRFPRQRDFGPVVAWILVVSLSVAIVRMLPATQIAVDWFAEHSFYGVKGRMWWAVTLVVSVNATAAIVLTYLPRIFRGASFRK